MADASVFMFEHDQLLAGVLSGLALSALLRNRIVATLLATGIAGGLVWGILAAPDGPTALFEAGVARLSKLASEGFLTGALLAKSGVSIVESLARAGPRGRR
ncbi:hypothetical protein [Roseovarius sp.]|uniref:hypothetical protein n=1 Tax=Roseovarius sp. TaxID=1486281 RepID=UPI003568FACA